MKKLNISRDLLGLSWVRYLILPDICVHVFLSLLPCS